MEVLTLNGDSIYIEDDDRNDAEAIEVAREPSWLIVYDDHLREAVSITANFSHNAIEFICLITELAGKQVSLAVGFGMNEMF